MGVNLERDSFVIYGSQKIVAMSIRAIARQLGKTLRALSSHGCASDMRWPRSLGATVHPR